MCYGSSIDVADVNNDLQDDLDKLISQTETSKSQKQSHLVLAIPSNVSIDSQSSSDVPPPPGHPGFQDVLWESPIPNSSHLNINVSVTDDQVFIPVITPVAPPSSPSNDANIEIINTESPKE